MDELLAVRNMVVTGGFNPNIQEHISCSMYVDEEQAPTSPAELKRKKECGCRKGCTPDVDAGKVAQSATVDADVMATVGMDKDKWAGGSLD